MENAINSYTSSTNAVQLDSPVVKSSQVFSDEVLSSSMNASGSLYADVIRLQPKKSTQMSSSLKKKRTMLGEDSIQSYTKIPKVEAKSYGKKQSSKAEITLNALAKSSHNFEKLQLHKKNSSLKKSIHIATRLSSLAYAYPKNSKSIIHTVQGITRHIVQTSGLVHRKSKFDMVQAPEVKPSWSSTSKHLILDSNRRYKLLLSSSVRPKKHVGGPYSTQEVVADLLGTFGAMFIWSILFTIAYSIIIWTKVTKDIIRCKNSNSHPISSNILRECLLYMHHEQVPTFEYKRYLSYYTGRSFMDTPIYLIYLIFMYGRNALSRRELLILPCVALVQLCFIVLINWMAKRPTSSIGGILAIQLPLELIAMFSIQKMCQLSHVNHLYYPFWLLWMQSILQTLMVPLYEALLPLSFTEASTNFNKAMVRLFIHPIIWEIHEKGVRMAVQALQHQHSYSVHSAILIVKPRFFNALIGRFLLSSLSSIGDIIVINIMLMLLDLGARLATKDKDAWLYQLFTSREHTQRILDSQTSRDLRAAFQFIDMFSEVVGVITVSVMYISGNISHTAGVGADLWTVATNMMVQLSTLLLGELLGMGFENKFFGIQHRKVWMSQHIFFLFLIFYIVYTQVERLSSLILGLFCLQVFDNISILQYCDQPYIPRYDL